MSDQIHDELTGRRLAGFMTKAPHPFCWFDSSPEVIRLVPMMYVRYPLSRDWQVNFAWPQMGLR